MEKMQIEFESYIDTLASALRVDHGYKSEICSEIRQNLYDKQRELLIKGHSLQASVADTLACFEKPERLARSFNRVYLESSALSRIFCSGKFALVFFAATLVIAFGLL